MRSTRAGATAARLDANGRERQTLDAADDTAVLLERRKRSRRRLGAWSGDLGATGDEPLGVADTEAARPAAAAIPLDPEADEAAEEATEEQQSQEEPNDDAKRKTQLLLLDRELALNKGSSGMRDRVAVTATVVLAVMLVAFAVSLTPGAAFVPASGTLFFTSFSFIILLPLFALYPLAIVQVDHRTVPERSRYLRAVAWFAVACGVLLVFETVLSIVDVAVIYENGVPSGSVPWQRSIGCIVVMCMMLIGFFALVALVYFQFMLLVRPDRAPTAAAAQTASPSTLGRKWR